jgi:hypothetical protein
VESGAAAFGPVDQTPSYEGRSALKLKLVAFAGVLAALFQTAGAHWKY